MDKTYLGKVNMVERALREDGVDVDVDADEKVDKGIVRVMSKLWWNGVKAHTGNFLLAGLLH